jgi:hypothetical protein
MKLLQAGHFPLIPLRVNAHWDSGKRKLMESSFRELATDKDVLFTLCEECVENNGVLLVKFPLARVIHDDTDMLL